MILSTSLCEHTLPPDEEALRELAGELIFKRGMEYFTRGQVIGFADHGNGVEAFVLGARAYRTGLRREAEESLFHCDCPVGRENRFCKHAVALGLRWLRRAGEERGEEAWERVIEHATGSLRLGLSDDGGWRELVRQTLDNLLRSSPASALDLIEDAIYDSERVRIWLAEGEVEEAYRAAMSGDCADDLWLKLAALRIRTDPAGTLEIYKRLVRKSLGRKDRYSAKQAGKLLRKTCRLMKRLGREEEYGEFVDELSRTFGSQRNFACLFSRGQG
ncbi:MAG: SWIM zinc finger family protein [Blastocatellia bacterium]